MAVDSLSRIVGPVALTTTAATTVYTVPASTVTTIRDIQVTNETGTAATFTMSIGTDGAGKRLFYQTVVPANGFISSQRQIVLAAGEILQASSQTSSALTLTISAVVTS